MKVSELVTKTGLKTFNEGADKEIMGVYISDMVSDIVGIKEGNLLITLQTHKNLIAAANVVDAGMVVFAHGKRPADDVVELADRLGIALFCTADDTWSFAVKLFELGMR